MKPRRIRTGCRMNGKAPFGDGLEYDDGPEGRPSPTPADLEPVKISARGASASGSTPKRN